MNWKKYFEILHDAIAELFMQYDYVKENEALVQNGSI